jgi:hypothetical protein
MIEQGYQKGHSNSDLKEMRWDDSEQDGLGYWKKSRGQERAGKKLKSVWGG